MTNEADKPSVEGLPMPTAEGPVCKHPNAKCVYDSDDGEFERWQCPSCGARWGVEIPQ